jgi:hypothetical protein
VMAVTARAEDEANWPANRVGEHERLAQRWRAPSCCHRQRGRARRIRWGSRDLTYRAWVAVVTTIGVGLAAHVASTQHDRIAVADASTADERQHLRGTLGSGVPFPDAAARLVANVERVLAVQNQGWTSLIS